MISAKAGFVWMFLGLTTIAGFLVGKFGGAASELICLPAGVAVLVGSIVGFVQVFEK